MNVVYVKAIDRALEIPACWDCYDRGWTQGKRQMDLLPCTCEAGDRFKAWLKAGMTGKIGVEVTKYREDSEEGRMALAIYEARFGPISDYEARQKRNRETFLSRWQRVKRRLRGMD